MLRNYTMATDATDAINVAVRAASHSSCDHTCQVCSYLDWFMTRTLLELGFSREIIVRVIEDRLERSQPQAFFCSAQEMLDAYWKRAD